jgi:hypothetical protein
MRRGRPSRLRSRGCHVRLFTHVAADALQMLNAGAVVPIALSNDSADGRPRLVSSVIDLSERPRLCSLRTVSR